MYAAGIELSLMKKHNAWGMVGAMVTVVSATVVATRYFDDLEEKQERKLVADSATVSSVPASVAQESGTPPARDSATLPNPVSAVSGGSVDKGPATKPGAPQAPSVQLVLEFEGDTISLLRFVPGKLPLPLRSDIAATRAVRERIVVTLRTEFPAPVYGQRMAKVDLAWRWLDAVTGEALTAGNVIGITANGPDSTSAANRAIATAVDTMVSRLRRSGLALP